MGLLIRKNDNVRLHLQNKNNNNNNNNNTPQYFNPEHQTLQHYLYPEIFLRATKKAYLSYITL
ncbi:MAG: hypothetical protein ACJ71D_08005 [Nitrososphaera sp.]